MNRKAIGIAVIWIGLASVLAAAGPKYDISLTVDFEEGTFAGTARVVYTDETEERLSDLFFRLLPNGDEIYGDGAIRVSGVSVDGEAVKAELSLGGTALRIPLPTPIEPGGSVVVELSFEGEAGFSFPGPSAGYGVLTKSESALTLSAFYPIVAVRGDDGWELPPVPGFGDALVSDYAAYEVTITTEAGLGVIATGRMTGSTVSADLATYRFVSAGARDFSVVIVDGYEMEEERSGDITIRTWFLPADRAGSRITRELAIEAIALYEGTVGELSESEIELVEVPLREAAGVESSGVILISSEYAKRPEDPFYRVIVSHEVAHQWFYDTVGNDVIEDPWLDEGLATYLSHIFLEQTRPSEAADQKRRWERSYDAAEEKYPDLSVTARLPDFPDVSSYTEYVYSGGALLFDAIRTEIGDRAFFAGLSDYYRANSGGIATPDLLISAFERACECELDRVFVRFSDR